ncbi:hypothetical protein LCGC14_3039480 [marine sediment metagenome]|uniref:Uncharacterized protein n=1 Tax=marine sediment metagenome TaxID=412755 RepID=A0A0F8WQM2_9ZZZZ
MLSISHLELDEWGSYAGYVSNRACKGCKKRIWVLVIFSEPYWPESFCGCKKKRFRWQKE